MIDLILFNLILMYFSICYYLKSYINKKKITYKCDNNSKNIAITICCEGRGHLTQFINFYKSYENKEHIKMIFLNKEIEKLIPIYFIEFCNEHKISIEWLYQNIHLYNSHDNNIDYPLTLLLGIYKIWGQHIDEMMKFYNILSKYNCSTILNFGCTDLRYYLSCGPKNITVYSYATMLKFYNTYENKYYHKNEDKKLNFIDNLIGTVGLNFNRHQILADNNICLSPIKPIYEKYTTYPCLIDIQVQHDIHYDNYFKNYKKQKNILVYLLYEQYYDHFIKLAMINKNIQYFVFCRSDDIMIKDDNLDNIIRFNLNNSGFKHMMNMCDIYIGSAGVESVCEAIFLKKPTILIPTIKHYEQITNAKLFSENLEHIYWITHYNKIDEISKTIDQILKSDMDNYKNECDNIVKYYTNKQIYNFKKKYCFINSISLPIRSGPSFTAINRAKYIANNNIVDIYHPFIDIKYQKMVWNKCFSQSEYIEYLYEQYGKHENINHKLFKCSYSTIFNWSTINSDEFQNILNKKYDKVIFEDPGCHGFTILGNLRKLNNHTIICIHQTNYIDIIPKLYKNIPIYINKYIYNHKNIHNILYCDIINRDIKLKNTITLPIHGIDNKYFIDNLPNKNSVYFIGKLDDSHKNINKILKLTQNICYLHVYGIGRDKHILDNYKHCIYHGLTNNINDLANHKIYISYSAKEGICTATIEALSMNKFCLLYDCECNEIFKDMKNAHFFKDDQEFKEKLLYLIKLEPTIELNKQKFTWDNANKIFYDYILKLDN